MCSRRDDLEDDLFSAGEVAPAGRYQRVDVVWGRTVVLDGEDRLPASLDGRVALHRKLQSPACLRSKALPVLA